MRSCLLVLLFFSVVSLVCISEAARHGPEDYWKKIVQDVQMPKALSDLVHEDSSRSDDHHHRRYSNNNVDQHPETLNMKRFLTNFDTSPNLIIYQSKVVIH